MKKQISVTIDEKTLEIVEQIIQNGVFRNKSHFFEFGLNKLIKELKNEEK